LQAVAEVRKHRPGSLQTRAQVEHVTKFAHYLACLRTIFPSSKHQKHAATSFITLIAKQRRLLHGEMGVRLRYVPQLVDEVSQELRNRAGADAETQAAVRVLLTVDGSGLDGENRRQVEVVKQQVNEGKWEGVARLASAGLAQLLLDWLRTLQVR
jgi:hypothetical protein